MLTVLLAAVEPAYPLLAGCVSPFEVSAFVLPPPPQAADIRAANCGHSGRMAAAE